MNFSFENSITCGGQLQLSALHRAPDHPHDAHIADLAQPFFLAWIKMTVRMAPNRSTHPRFILLALVLLALLLAFAALQKPDPAGPNAIPDELGPSLTYEIVSRYPHDPTAYTQGLVFHAGVFYESAGLYGESSLREVDPQTGTVNRQSRLPDAYFAEGLVLLGGKLYQLTWREQTGFIYDLDFNLLNTFTYPTEGWGLTTDGTYLILSDGSDKLTFYDPETFSPAREVSVTWNGQPVRLLNELEYIQGAVWANIYLTDQIARIDPASGAVLSMLDLTGLQPAANAAVPGEVLNGIAYDPESGRLFVTGKHWPWLYEIRLSNPEIQPTPLRP